MQATYAAVAAGFHGRDGAKAYDRMSQNLLKRAQRD